MEKHPGLRGCRAQSLAPWSGLAAVTGARVAGDLRVTCAEVRRGTQPHSRSRVTGSRREQPVWSVGDPQPAAPPAGLPAGPEAGWGAVTCGGGPSLVGQLVGEGVTAPVAALSSGPRSCPAAPWGHRGVTGTSLEPDSSVSSWDPEPPLRRAGAGSVCFFPPEVYRRPRPAVLCLRGPPWATWFPRRWRSPRVRDSVSTSRMARQWALLSGQHRPGQCPLDASRLVSELSTMPVLGSWK